MFPGDTSGASRRSRLRGVLLTATLSAVALTGCYQKMGVQPALDPYDSSEFFDNNMSARPRVEGTVAQGELFEDEFLHTGNEGGQPAQRFPFAVTEDVLDRGQERYNIYCMPCHGPTGEGDGMIVRRGFKQPTSFHADTVRAQPEGYYFTVITQGYGVMPSYKAQVPAEDRWAIIAYMRALQLSQRATVVDIPQEELTRLEAQTGGAQ